jgi:hypothetical protein
MIIFVDSVFCEIIQSRKQILSYFQKAEWTRRFKVSLRMEAYLVISIHTSLAHPAKNTVISKSLDMWFGETTGFNNCLQHITIIVSLIYTLYRLLQLQH